MFRPRALDRVDAACAVHLADRIHPQHPFGTVGQHFPTRDRAKVSTGSRCRATSRVRQQMQRGPQAVRHQVGVARTDSRAPLGVTAGESAAGARLDEEHVGAAAQLADRPRRVLDLERHVVERQRHHVGVRRHRVDPLLPACAEQVDVLAAVQPRHVPARDRRRRHHVAAGDQHRVTGCASDHSVADDVLVEADPHRRVVPLGVHPRAHGDRLLHLAQRLGHRHLVDEQIARREALLGHPVPGLHDGGVAGVGRFAAARGGRDHPAQVGGVDAAVVALVDHLHGVLGADHRQRHLQPA